MREPPPLPPAPPEPSPSLPAARIRQRLGAWWIWLTPLGALVLVVYLVVTLLSSRGPRITITFQSADGLVENQTQVRFKAVNLGTVGEIELSPDRSQVVAHVRMSRRAEALLTDGARFWVVRPRLGAGLSAFQAGLQTLVSGAYVAIDPGDPDAPPQDTFYGLENPPSVRSDEPGTVYFLEADSFGGLSTDAPIFYREVQVGRALSYDLKGADHRVRIRIFVNAPYDQWVVPQTRFWNSSGLRLTTDAEGLHVEMASARSLLSGGIAFYTPEEGSAAQPSAAESTFRLYADRSEAELGSFEVNVPYVSYFQSSVRGLTVGSEVHLFGRKVGAVTDVAIVSDGRAGHEGELAARVSFLVQPKRVLRGADREALLHPGMRGLVSDGLRVVLESANFLTGTRVLALQYVPGAAPSEPWLDGEALVLPSEARGFAEAAEALSAVAAKLNELPLGRIGHSVEQSLAALSGAVGGGELRRTVRSLDATLRDVRDLAAQAKQGFAPVLARLPRISAQLERAVSHAEAALGATGMGADSSMQRNLQRMMEQVSEASRSVRLLADFLNRHPESMVRGRSQDSP